MRLHDLLEYRAREQPEADFACHRGRRVSYGQAVDECRRLAHVFVDSGLEGGDRVAFLARNSVEHVLLYFAASMAGVVPVPLNFRLPASQWRFIVNDARARMFIVAGAYAAAVEGMRGDLASVTSFLHIGGPPHAGWSDYGERVAAAAAALPRREVRSDDALYQFYTSGTTGHPKGAVISHRALIAHLMQVSAFYGIDGGRRILVATPLSHAHAAIQAFVSACWGGCLHIMDGFEPGELLRTLAQERISIEVVVPSMIRACLASVPDIASRRFEHLRLMHYGAAPIAESTLRRAMEVFGCDFVQGYGMTETTAGVSFLLAADHRRALHGKPGLLRSAGRAALGNELRVVDAQDQPLAAGTLGEVVVRGPTLMSGYWERPQATAQALRNGWMHTGDLGLIDGEGYLYIVDRADDVINSGGENVYPRMVEEVLFHHAAVADAAAIGVPDDQWGEAVKALVVLRDGCAATAAELLALCGEHLAGFQRPRSIEFRDALPYTASGKILRRNLREPYWAGQERRIAGA